MSAGRPPPERRTFEGAGSRACKSFRPRLIVLRATPVARATMVTPPYPAARASAAQNNRLPRSSRRRRNASKRLANRCFVNHAAVIDSSRNQGNPHPAARQRGQPLSTRFTYFAASPYFPATRELAANTRRISSWRTALQAAPPNPARAADSSAWHSSRLSCAPRRENPHAIAPSRPDRPLESRRWFSAETSSAGRPTRRRRSRCSTASRQRASTRSTPPTPIRPGRRATRAANPRRSSASG